MLVSDSRALYYITHDHVKTLVRTGSLNVTRPVVGAFLIFPTDSIVVIDG